jgi:sarcosine oxidase
MFDVIVVGLGGMGSAAACHLASRGARVLGLEQFRLAHDRGSSHGATRIIRLAYAEHPDYVPLLRRAYVLWRDLERTAGEPLLFVTGGIDAGTAASGTVTGSLRSCAAHDLPHEVLEAADLHRRFPGYALPPGMVAVYQPDAGFVLPERAILAHAAAARAAGADLREEERVEQWTAGTSAVRVRTDRGVYEAGRLVITAGPWLFRVVPSLAPLAVPERQVLIWTAPRRPEYFQPSNFPIFNMEAPEGRFYGFPIAGVEGFKLGRYHHREEDVDPDRMNRSCGPEDEAVLREGIGRYFPDADGPTLAMTTCLFTNSPDEHFVIDRLREEPRVIVAGGFSGHGFKFAPVVGEILADLALEGGTRHDIGLFTVARYDRSSPA